MLQQLPADAQKSSGTAYAPPAFREGLAHHGAAHVGFQLLDGNPSDVAAHIGQWIRCQIQGLVDGSVHCLQAEGLAQKAAHSGARQTKALLGTSFAADGHDDGQGAQRSKQLEHVEARSVGKHEVENHECWNGMLDAGSHLPDRASALDAVSFLFEEFHQRFGQSGVVLHDQCIELRPHHGARILVLDVSHEPFMEPRTTAPPGGSPQPTSAVTDEIVRTTVAAAVTRAERLFAGLRILFCVAVVALFFLTADGNSTTYVGRALLEAGVVVVATLFSAWVFWRSRRGPFSARELVVSVAVDAGLCTVGLGSNTLFPYDGYPGLLQTLDIAVVPLVIVSSVFRVYHRAVWVSGGLCTTGMVTLLWVDASAGLPVPLEKGVLFLLYLAAATALAAFATQRALEIFERVGRAAVRAEGARSGILALLQDHHDVRSVLCDLQLNAERLVGNRPAVVGEREETELLARMNKLSSRLKSGIERLSTVTGRTRDRALAAAAGLDQPQPAEVAESFRRSAAAVCELFPSFTVEPFPEGEVPPVLFGQGNDGLTRFLTHLLINAAEGNEQGQAARAWLRISRVVPGRLILELEDDGPGFSEQLLRVVGRSHGTSSKVGSAGIGLWLARSSVVAVGGGFSAHNGQFGAKIRVELPTPAPEHLRRDRAT